MASKGWRVELKLHDGAKYVIACLAPTFEEAIVVASQSAEDAGHKMWSLVECVEFPDAEEVLA